MEKLLNNLKTNKKLKVSFGIIIVCLLIISIVSLISLWRVGNSMESFYNISYKNSVAQLQFRRDTQSVMKNLLRSCTSTDKEKTTQFLNAMEDDLVSQSEQLEFLKNNSKDTELLNELVNKMSVAIEVRDKVVEYSKANDVDGALKEFNETYAPVLDEIQNTLQQMGDNCNKDAENSFNDVKMIQMMSYILIIGIIVISFALSFYLIRVVSRLLVKPIQQLEEATLQLSKGNFNIEVEYDSKDELGILTQNFKKTSVFLRNIINDLNHIMSELSIGSFDVRTTCENEYIGEFKPLLLKVREMIVKVSGALSQINEASNQVSVGSDQLAESAQNLAEGATEQAGSVEELQATITNVLQQTSKNTKQSYETSVKAVQVKTEVQRSNKDMSDMTAAMEKINDTSKQINNIIIEIEDIASQTNLLSLNAAIEAARAGDAGRGFAVVADQIRKLAEDSAKSAVNTKNLIETSISEVKNGNNIANRTAVSLGRVIEGIEHITQQIEENSSASQSQEESMKQIEDGISQISEIVQNNSATAEETSATSEELSAQAENMRELVLKFDLRKD